jgi:hypothetical protein
MPPAYVLPDDKLRVYDHGLGTLRVDGELKGYLASIVGEIRFPRRGGPWPWFVVVWLDGAKEPSFEAYGPQWLTVRDLDAGRLDHFERSVRRESRFLWMRFESVSPGPPCVFDFEWLPAGLAAQKWKELGLVDSDF